jgi:hypothetical protein
MLNVEPVDLTSELITEFLARGKDLTPAKDGRGILFDIRNRRQMPLEVARRSQSLRLHDVADVQRFGAQRAVGGLDLFVAYDPCG